MELPKKNCWPEVILIRLHVSLQNLQISLQLGERKMFFFPEERKQIVVTCSQSSWQIRSLLCTASRERRQPLLQLLQRYGHLPVCRSWGWSLQKSLWKWGLYAKTLIKEIDLNWKASFFHIFNNLQAFLSVWWKGSSEKKQSVFMQQKLSYPEPRREWQGTNSSI